MQKYFAYLYVSFQTAITSELLVWSLETENLYNGQETIYLKMY